MGFQFRQFKEGEKLTGTYIKRYWNIGQYKKIVYEFVFDGEKISHHVWGNAIINKYLYSVPFYSKVSIEYRGLQITPESGTNKIHVYNITVLKVGKSPYSKGR